MLISTAAPSTIAVSTTWPCAAALRLEQRAHHAVGEEHAATAEVAHHVERRHGRLAGAAEVGQRTGERDVVDVVTGGLRVRAVLAPPGHAPEHELRVAGQAHVGADAEALHHAGAEAFDERVGMLDEIEQRGDAVGVLQVERHVAAAAQHDVVVRACRARGRAPHWARSTRMTSAPMSDSSIAANGPGPMPAISMMRYPVSGPAMPAVFSGRARRSRHRRASAACVQPAWRVWLRIASTSMGHSGSGMSWPMSAMSSRLRAGDELGRARYHRWA